ncbi:MAG: hypothetical protein KIT10_13625 [Flavobacteriales bacterium]|nr:hypothetical protein [Flavobacteriales bacterium]
MVVLCATAMHPLRAQWDDVPRSGTSEILDDQLSIRLRHVKPQFLAVFFERRRVVHFTGPEDIATHGTVVLPESLDPPYDRRFDPWHLRDGAPRTRWLNMRLDLFHARVKRDGAWLDLPVVQRSEQDELRTLRTIEKAWSQVIAVQDITPGDTVEFHWKYMLPYDYNWPATMGWRGLEWVDNWARLTSWRVFFHGDLPIRRQQVEVLFNLKHGLAITGPPPDERIEKGNEVTARWEHHDLPGCMSEVNARPADDLPHLVMRMEPEDFRYWRRDRLSGISFPNPYWMQVVRHREARAFWWRQVSRKRIPDKQNQYVKDFARRVSAGVPDSLPARRMARIHDHIAEHFTYEDDRLWYLDMDRRNARIGEQVREGRLRDISRYDMYSKLVNLLRLRHATAYVLDKRIGRMTETYLTPLWDSEFVFRVSDRYESHVLHPKRTRWGWYADELPFYWQGTAALHLDLDILLEDLERPAVFVDLPEGDVAANVRGVEYVIEVDPEQGAAHGEVMVFLSGQYSTLGRAAFLGLPIDSTVDPLYGWRPGDGHKTLDWKVDLASDPPYRVRARASIDLSDRLTPVDDSTFALDLSALVRHVVPDGFRAEGRTLPFHWDFAGKDVFRIDLRCSEPVKLIEGGTFDVEISGSGSDLQRRIMTSTVDRISLESVLHIGRERVEALHAAGLEVVIDGAKAQIPILQLVRIGREP